jgi:predicted nucleic acid-binding protein
MLWELLRQGKYQVYLSDVTLEEIRQCNQEKIDKLLKYLKEIEYTTLEITDETENLAEEIISSKILSRKSYDDCLHISSAVISECDIIVSWNFKHIVNVETIDGVRIINIRQGYKPINIYAPSMIVYKEEE